MPAPLGNTNASRHGLRTRFSLRLGKLPKKFRAVENDVNAFRRLLESLIVEAKGEITMLDACLVNTAAKHERASRLCHAWLRKNDSDMSHSDRLSYVRQIASSSAERDKAIRSLNLDATGDADIWKDLHAPEQPAHLAAQPAETKPGDTSHAKAQQATDEPSIALLDARHPQGLAKSSEAPTEDLGTRFTDPSNGFPIVSSSGDSECPRDNDIQVQRSEGPSNAWIHCG